MWKEIMRRKEGRRRRDEERKRKRCSKEVEENEMK
jgi:hypothetical protein